jgi:hypothetical protein
MLTGTGSAGSKRSFNDKGPCVPAMHYMVDTSAKIDAIVHDYIEQGDYITINRARQFGKTTTLTLLHQRLQDKYVVISMSFESATSYFESLEAFAEGFSLDVTAALSAQSESLAALWRDPQIGRFPDRYLKERITQTCTISEKPVVLIIDEVDRATDFDVFIAFLGLLRDMYIERNTRKIPAFKSVVLAGVHDIKNLRKKIRPDSEHSYNSPWNIAADFKVDLAFSASEIATMLGEYETDHATGMSIAAVSERLSYYTSGYPYLVSRLCIIIDEANLEWSPDGVDAAETRLLMEKNTLFDDMIKNVKNSGGLDELLEAMLLRGAELGYDPDNPDVNLGLMYGIFKREDNGVGLCVSNIVFETRLYNYYASLGKTKELVSPFTENRLLFVSDGYLDMDAVCSRFAAFMRSEYRDEDGSFIEKHARLLFLAFLKPIINGAGHYVVEPQTRGSRRMDVVVLYGCDEYIVELKIWRGEAWEQAGVEQLAGYLRTRGRSRGWLVSFCDLLKSPREGGVREVEGMEIAETIIAYRDKE